ncbi:MAG: hypothetical protein ACP5LP_03540 [Candidatus Micrarchaeia archaeon]
MNSIILMPCSAGTDVRKATNPEVSSIFDLECINITEQFLSIFTILSFCSFGISSTTYIVLAHFYLCQAFQLQL